MKRIKPQLVAIQYSYSDFVLLFNTHFVSNTHHSKVSLSFFRSSFMVGYIFRSLGTFETGSGFISRKSDLGLQFVPHRCLPSFFNHSVVKSAFSIVDNGGKTISAIKGALKRKWHHHSIPLPRFSMGWLFKFFVYLLQFTSYSPLLLCSILKMQNSVWDFGYGKITQTKFSINQPDKRHIIRPKLVVCAIKRQNLLSSLTFV